MALARLVAGQGLSRQIATAGLLLIPVGLGFGHDVLVVAGLAALVVRAALAAPAEAPPRDLAHRLGEASFGIYLSWVFVEAGLVLLLRLADPGLAARQGLMVAGLAATFLAGWIAWRVIEVPAAAWLSRGR
jgi:peptidoglycan/LPS O-acetylase OafA/YrhL